MFHALVAVMQQVLVTVGSAAVLVLATVASSYLSRLFKAMARLPQAHRFKIDHGAVHVDVMITTGDTPQGRKPLNDAADDGQRN
jgi:hypothetical protein